MTVLVTDTIFIIISYIHNSVESIVLVNCQFLVFSIIEPTGNCIDMKQLSSTLSYPNRYICSLNDIEYTFIYIYIYIYIYIHTYTHTHTMYIYHLIQTMKIVILNFTLELSMCLLDIFFFFSF